MPEADADPARVVVGRAGRGELGVDDALQVARQAEPAEPLGEVHPGQPGVEPGPQELQPVPGRVVLGQEGGEALLEPCLVHSSSRRHMYFLSSR